jgi:predicted TIM-barrel fold metal-dependent hydrolase
MLIDVHGHPPRTPADTQRYLDALKRWDSRLIVAALGPRAKGWQNEPEIDDWRIANEECAAFVRQHPETLAAYCYINPAHTREALDEMERRLAGQRDTFIALKLWVAVRCSDARLDPIMEFCAAHGVPVLQHTWMKVGPDGPGSGNLPGESTPLDLLALARRHPKVKFFGGHTGGDWEWGVAALKQVDNVWLDVAGGESAGAYAQIALSAVGAGRIVYGTDVPGRSVPSQLSKVLCLDVSSDDLDRMLWKNAAEILGDRLPAAWGVSGVPAAATRAARPIVLTTEPPAVETPLVDVNAWLGDWPSRRLGASLEERLREMDLHGIERAVVSPLEAVFLKDVDAANRDLHAQLASSAAGSGRLLPAYVVNPMWPAWEEQLDRCVSQYGLTAGRGAIRLIPSFHGYRVDAESLAPFFGRVGALDVPVIVTVQLEDARMHHPAMRAADAPLDSIAAAIRRYPGLRWVVANCTQTQIVSLGKQLPEGARVVFDVARVQGPIDCFWLLAEAPGVGVRRLAFGTNAPLLVPESPLMELADARFTAPEIEAIARGNAARMVGLAS